MNYSKLTKTQIIEGITNRNINISDLSDELKDNKEIVLEAVKSDGFSLIYVLQNDVELLELLEKVDISCWQDTDIKWYEERMEILSFYKDNEFMNKVIVPSNKKTKKLKF